MSAQVFDLPTPQAVDLAWNEYQRLVLAELANPSLAADREHVTARIRAHDRFQQVFLASEKTAPMQASR